MEITPDEHSVIADVFIKNGYMSFTHKAVNYDESENHIFDSLVEKGMVRIIDDCYYITGKTYDYVEDYAARQKED